jgi:DNA-directed RNA polymerase subunit RPC12/RpoP
MEDEEALTYKCKNCGALIYYKPCDVPEGILLVSVTNCPKCSTIIPELQKAIVIAFERPEN